MLSIGRMVWLALGCAMAISAPGCTVHRFDGDLAELRLSADLVVIGRVAKYGDCYRLQPSVPILYELRRDNYVALFAPGTRYWAELFLSVETPTGGALEISGSGISSATTTRGTRLAELTQRTELALRSDVAFEYLATFDAVASDILEFEVRALDGTVLGNETLDVLISKVRCSELDAL